MNRTKILLSLSAISLALIAGCSSDDTPVATAPAPLPTTKTVIFVWDGLRPDAVTATNTPNLFALRQAGTWFADNHSTYPTFTMMNGSSFATGSFPKTSGFYGNTFWTPPQGTGNTIPVGQGAGGAAADYTDPVFTEDWSILTTLDAYYGGQLLLVKTLFQAAQAAGLKTATIGKSGAAFIQDLKQGGVILDENTVVPLSLAPQLQAAGFALPANIVHAYPAGSVTLTANNGTPTAQAATVQFTLPTSAGAGLKANDPTDVSGAKATAANKYMMDAFLNVILPTTLPDLSLVWFRDPDSTEHAYGPGSANHLAALKAQDDRLGDLLAKLKSLGLDSTTNVIVVSDHAHSNVSGSTALYPLRAISAGALGALDATNGFSVSGDVRSADLLTRAGFTHVYDGSGCLKSGMVGIKADGSTVYPLLTDADGSVCGTAGTTYHTAAFKVPATLPTGSTGDQPIVIAANGGSDYFYVPSHDAATIQKLVTTLQKRLEYGAVFIDSRYGDLPGTLSMKGINLENATRSGNGQPDVIASFAFDATQTINGLPGVEYESFQGNRGMHGSFSPIDVHNTLLAQGPAFKAGATVSTPSGNVDVAPTVAYLFKTSMPEADGRVLYEGLQTAFNAGKAAPAVAASVVNPTTAATGLTFQSPVDPTGATLDTSFSQGSYSIDLAVKDLTIDGKSYRYFDSATAVRR